MTLVSVVLLAIVAQAPPPVSAHAVYEDFEGYRGVLTQSPWPHEGGWMVSPYGFLVDAALDHVVKHGGDFGLRLRYRVGDSEQIGISRLYAPPLRWDRYDGVRFWLRPDGSGRRLTFFVLEQVRADHKKWFWESGVVMTGTDPVIVTMPFSTFVQSSASPDAHKRFDWREIEETVFWVRSGDERGRPTRNGTGPRNPEIPATIWIDDVEVVKLARPLDHVVVTPAVAPARSADAAVRIDYGAEADWTDAEGHRWRADVPATEGILVVDPNAPIDGAAHPTIYRTQRRGVRRLRIAVPNGRHDVVLHFAELDGRVAATGERAFTVEVEGVDVGVVDPFTLAGGVGRPCTRAVTVDVRDGALDVGFEPRRGEPTIAAIEVVPAR